MFADLDGALQLGIDCFAAIAPGRAVVLGWSRAPRGAVADLAVVAGPAGPCLVEHGSFHPRPGGGAEAEGSVTTGFALVVELPVAPPALELVLSAAGQELRADLRDARVAGDLPAAIGRLGAGAVLGLMRGAATDPALAPLLSWQGRSFGAFGDVVAGLPLVRGRGGPFRLLAEVEAVATPAGESVAMLRGFGAMAAEARVEAVALGWLRPAPGEVAAPAVLPLADLHGARLPAALGVYLRLDPALAGRVPVLDLIVRVEPRPGEEAMLRIQPAIGSVPDLLDAAARSLAATLDDLPEGATEAGTGFLGQVAARREAAFAPPLAALAGTAEPPTIQLPRTLLLLGADDPLAARLLHVTAPVLERSCERLLVLGGAAEAVAEPLLRRGRIAVEAGAAAAEALRGAAGRAGLRALDVADYAEAVIAGGAEDVPGAALSPAEIARLLALDAVAGCGSTLAESLRRLLRLRAGRGFAPVPRSWGNPAAAAPAQEHLRRLWEAGTAARPEHAAHG